MKKLPRLFDICKSIFDRVVKWLGRIPPETILNWAITIAQCLWQRWQDGE
jgi:hypothetical protein